MNHQIPGDHVQILQGFQNQRFPISVFSGESHQTVPIKPVYPGRFILSFSLSSDFSTKVKQQNAFLSSSFLISLGVQTSISSSSFFMTIYPFICLSSGCHGVSGGSKEVTGVCLGALSSAFLMSLKHQGSANYGDEAIQEGQKVTDLANRDSFCSSYLSFPFFLFSSL